MEVSSWMFFTWYRNVKDSAQSWLFHSKLNRKIKKRWFENSTRSDEHKCFLFRFLQSVHFVKRGTIILVYGKGIQSSSDRMQRLIRTRLSCASNVAVWSNSPVNISHSKRYEVSDILIFFSLEKWNLYLFILFDVSFGTNLGLGRDELNHGGIVTFIYSMINFNSCNVVGPISSLDLGYIF